MGKFHQQLCMCVFAQRLARAFSPGFSDIRKCTGVEKEAGPCEGLAPCEQCVGIDCTWRAWSDWAPVGGCTTLAMRSRVIERTNNECGSPCEGPKVITKKIAEDETCIIHKQNCKFGMWTIWAWDEDHTQKYRKRDIVKPSRLGGVECDGPLIETKPPPPRSPPIDCDFSAWGEWTQCSAPCGGGIQAHFRRVAHHAENGGKPCEGPTQSIEACNTELCNMVKKCEFTDWSDWSCCDHGYQQKYRTRKVEPTEIPNYRLCDPAAIKETAPCPIAEGDPCKVNPWSHWSQCPVTCGGAQQYRTRELDDPGNEPCKERPLKETRGCGQNPCEGGNCVFDDWEEWSVCSVKCGVGVMERKRGIQTFASEIGEGCRGKTKEADSCEMDPCGAVDCKWGVWDAWSACSARCGGGTKRRDRSVELAPKLGGKLCKVQAASEVVECNLNECGHCINGAWMEWSDWEACSATCGDGFTSRHRDVAVHPNNCGAPIKGYQDEFKACFKAKECIPSVDCKIGAWNAWGGCSASCLGVQERTRVVDVFARGHGNPCKTTSLKEVQECNSRIETPECESNPKPCVFGEWGDWSECSETCDGGQKTRERQIATPADAGGKPCIDTTQETAGCGTIPCNTKPPIDCKWGAWSNWGGCSRCGGQRFRVRQILQTASNGGKICDAKGNKETDVCKSNCEHEMYCAFSDWSSGGPCSAQCGPSTKIRQRSLRQWTHPMGEFLFKGLPSMACGGTQIEVLPCDTVPCDSPCKERIDGAFSPWNDWSTPTCTQLCERHRVTSVEAACGGKPATGAVVETKVCHYNCTVSENCEWGLWSDWSGSGSDGRCFEGAQRYRNRIILQDADGGLPCTGPKNETDWCKPDDLIVVNCILNPWTEWGECSASCGKGFKGRDRSIENQAAHGGRGCVGVLKELEACNTFSLKCHCPLDICPLWADCEMSSWSDWATDPTDPKGYQCFSRREVTREAVANGTACNGTLKMVKSCKTVVDCDVTDWSEWDSCDKKCDGGQQMRHRSIHTHPENGGMPCPESLIVTQGCNMKTCDVPDCIFTEWSEWSTCPATCGGGMVTRSRTYANPENCEGTLKEVKPCGLPACPHTNCKWTDWTEWSSCTCLCGGGQKTRDRNIEKVPSLGGAPCNVQDREEIAPCNTQPCGSTCIDGAWAEWEDWQSCSQTCQGGYTWRARQVMQEANDCGKPVRGFARETVQCNTDVPCHTRQDCGMSAWGAWSGCSCDCNGEKNRARAITHHARFGGKRCKGALKQVWPCNPSPGEQPPADCDIGREPCIFEDWTSWTLCSATCDGGTRTRTRNATTPKNGGKPCDGDLTVVDSCNTFKCNDCTPVDCTWGEWEQWGDCDKCGGQKRRFRHVIGHAACGGNACKPDAAEEIVGCPRKCHEPMFCTWGSWSSWGECDSICGNGTRFRERMLMVAAASQVGEAPLEEDARFLENKIGISSFDERQIEDRIRELRKQTQGSKTRRWQALIVAYACGGISLVLVLLAYRFFTKASDRADNARGEHMPLTQDSERRSLVAVE